MRIAERDPHQVKPAHSKKMVSVLEESGALKRQYNELRELRETQPEKQAASMAQAMEKSRASSEALISSLRSELEEHRRNEIELSQAVSMAESLQSENTLLRQELARAGGAILPASSASHTSELNDQRRLVAFYELITGIRVNLDDKGERAHCTLRVASDEGSARTVAFDLSLSPGGMEDASGEVEYMPTDVSGVEDRLPEYLREEITCA